MSPRDEKIAKLRGEGRRLAAIGAEFGLSRERVRQIALAYDKEHGTELVAALKRARKAGTKRYPPEIRDERKAQKIRERYGCGLNALLEINPGPLGDASSPARKYAEQKSHAIRKGIGFNLTIVEWWGIWQASGKWGQRGRWNGYVMARYGDVGPYEQGNVYITTFGQNVSDGYIKTPMAVRTAKRRERLKEKISLAKVPCGR